MEISNNYNVNFGAKFGPNLKKQLNKREGNGNPSYADFVEDTFNKIHDDYLLEGLTIEHANNERLVISHELCPEIKSNILVKVPRKSTLSQRILDIPAIKYIVAQTEVAYQNLEENYKSTETLKMTLLSEACKPASEITDAKIDFYTSLKDDITRTLNNIETINDELESKRNNIIEQIKIAKSKSKSRSCK